MHHLSHCFCGAAWIVGLSATSNARPGACTHVKGGSQREAESGSTSPRATQYLQNRVSQKAHYAADLRVWSNGKFKLVANLADAGHRGRVDHMREQETGRAVAVKIFPNSWIGRSSGDFHQQQPTSIENPWQDLAVLGLLNEQRCPYVCELFGMYRNEVETFMVSALAVEGDLFTWCELAPSPGACREAAARPLARELLEALQYIHSIGLAHRDVSLENVLVMATTALRPRIRLCDFAQASVGRLGKCASRGKVEYRAPESLPATGSYDTFKADVFAAGVAIFGMVAHDYPWNSTKALDCEMFAFIEDHGLRSFLGERTLRNGDRLLSEVLSENVVKLLEGLLELDPETRFSLDDVSGATKALDAMWLKAMFC